MIAPMSNKKSVKFVAHTFIKNADKIVNLCAQTIGSRDEIQDWFYEHAVIRLYREFETLMLDTLAGAMNNDSSTISGTVGIKFPKHLNEEVCKYLIVGEGYFDFKGRDGLIKTVKQFVPDTHYLLKTLKKEDYRDSLERLSALRNYAAHDSDKAKAAAKRAIGGARVGPIGNWLKKQGRLGVLVDSLKEIAKEIEHAAPR